MFSVNLKNAGVSGNTYVADGHNGKAVRERDDH